MNKDDGGLKNSNNNNVHRFMNDDKRFQFNSGHANSNKLRIIDL